MDAIDSVVREALDEMPCCHQAHDPQGYFLKFAKDSAANADGRTYSIKCDHLYRYTDRLVLIEKELTKRPVESVTKYWLALDSGCLLRHSHPFLSSPFGGTRLDLRAMGYGDDCPTVYYRDFRSVLPTRIVLLIVFAGNAMVHPVNRARVCQAILAGKALHAQHSVEFHYEVLETGSPDVSSTSEDELAGVRQTVRKLAGI